MKKVKLLRNKNLHPKKYEIGDIAEIPDRIAERWIDRKIAIEIKGKKTKKGK